MYLYFTYKHIYTSGGTFSGDWIATKNLLASKMNINEASVNDCATVARVCNLVSKRAARLAAVGIAAILEQIGY